MRTKRNPAGLAAFLAIFLCILTPACLAAVDPNLTRPADPNAFNIPGFRPPADEGKARLWALGCSALLIEWNGDGHDTLNTGPLTPTNIRGHRESLKSWWNTDSRRDLLRNLAWLETGGHRSDFEADGRRTAFSLAEALKAVVNADRQNELKVASEYYHKLGDKSLWGWDISRYICLCRWGYTVGYLREDEAWARIMPAARLLQKRFTSWNELAENYLIGRRYWSEKETREDEAGFKEAIDRLTESRTSPWVALSWDTDLGDGPVLGEPWSEGRTITVGQDANTVAGAMGMAKTGDTVFVPRGVYHESGIELKNGVRLLGAGMERTFIQGEPNDGWIISAEDCSGRIERLTVQQTGAIRVLRNSGGIHVLRSNVEVVECRSRNTTGHGIALRRCVTSVIRDCVAEGNMDCGLFVRGEGSEPVISDCVATGNKGDGFNVKCDGKALIQWNLAEDNDARGIVASGDGKGAFTVANNIVRKNTLGGIGVIGPESALIEKNLTEDNQNASISAREMAGKVIVKDNRCRGNKGYAIQVHVPDADISENECVENEGGIAAQESGKAGISRNRIAACTKYYAIHGANVADLAVEENQCIDNEKIAIFVTAKTSARVQDNRCEGNGGDGVQFNGQASGKILHNWCEGNFGNGISVFNTPASVLVTNNRCMGNDGSGIELSSAAKVIIKDNSFAGNAQCGSFIRKGASVKADGNKCEGNRVSGILVEDAGTKAMLQWNRCVDNRRGIWFRNGADGEANGNMCSENSWSGIAACGDGTSPVLTKNRCNDNGAWGIITWAGAKIDNLPADNIAQGNFRGPVMVRE